jgi:hypothetical protein
MAAALLLENGMDRIGVAVMLLAMLASGCTAARATSRTSQPAALPASVIEGDQRVVAYPHGRWLLYGDGSPASPYAWVWIPTGATPPPAAPPAR